MNRVVRSDRLPCSCAAPIRDHFIRVGVGARARAGLKNVERKMVVEFSFDDFFGRLCDRRCSVRVEQT